MPSITSKLLNLNQEHSSNHFFLAQKIDFVTEMSKLQIFNHMIISLR